MADTEGTRRHQLTLRAVDPADGKMGEVIVSYDRMQAVAKRSMGHAKECGMIMPMILEQPTAVFEGLRLDEDEDKKGFGWLCYCGIPEHAYRPDGTERSAFPGQVYLVFVNDLRVAYNWRWEKADSDDFRLPRDYETRFKKRVI